MTVQDLINHAWLATKLIPDSHAKERENLQMLIQKFSHQESKRDFARLREAIDAGILTKNDLRSPADDHRGP